jgi:hypothetical protein
MFRLPDAQSKGKYPADGSWLNIRPGSAKIPDETVRYTACSDTTRNND